MLKDLVVNLALGRDRDVAADYAISVAEAFAAHIAGVAFSYEPVIPATIFGGGIPADLIETQRQENEEAARAAIERFERAANRAGVSRETRLLDASFAGAADTFARTARRFDLTVAQQAERDRSGPEDVISEGALFGSGRPMIVIPYIQQQPLKLERVLVCWDGSRAAARAVGDAMPLLQRANNVEIVIVRNDAGKTDELTGAEIGAHLARHDIPTEVKPIVAAEIDVASAILSYAADAAADFMVMGAYGHSRLREFVLGGVTRDILASMTVPTLMSH
jgi:nucleotide-binding universal stress UspA family protein